MFHSGAHSQLLLPSLGGPASTHHVLGLTDYQAVALNVSFWPPATTSRSKTTGYLVACIRMTLWRDQQKGLKRLRRASATFSLGSPSEILLVGYPSGVHYKMAQPGQPATQQAPPRTHSRPLCRNSQLHPIDLIKSDGASVPPTAWAPCLWAISSPLAGSRDACR